MTQGYHHRLDSEGSRNHLDGHIRTAEQHCPRPGTSAGHTHVHTQRQVGKARIDCILEAATTQFCTLPFVSLAITTPATARVALPVGGRRLPLEGAVGVAVVGRARGLQACREGAGAPWPSLPHAATPRTRRAPPVEPATPRGAAPDRPQPNMALCSCSRSFARSFSARWASCRAAHAGSSDGSSWRHTGHVLCFLSHGTTHSGWKACAHGSTCIVSPSATHCRHTGHLSSSARSSGDGSYSGSSSRNLVDVATALSAAAAAASPPSSSPSITRRISSSSIAIIWSNRPAGSARPACTASDLARSMSEML
mmetsp:Transcript_15463/g.40004  ORF Transcript_15463/g.40004 Transcript_15463/m.40004 type:complete len:310 (+) Transcript_15463:63-992(+)